MKPEPFDLLHTPLGKGTVLLEASAGTGKTYALVGIVLRLLLDGSVDSIDQLLLVTFTVAATEELKGRVRSGLHRTLRAIDRGDSDPFFAALAKLPGARTKLEAALQSFDRASIHTIHGFCQRVLRESAFESRQPFQLEFEADPLPLLQQAAADALRALYEPQASLRTAILEEGDFTPKDLVASYRTWQRYPDVALEPTDPDPNAGLAELTEAVTAAMAAYDEQAADRLAQMEWLANDSLFDDKAAVAGLLRRLPSQPVLTLKYLRCLGRSRIGDWIKETSRHHANHPFFTACDAVGQWYDHLHDHLRAFLLHHMHHRLATQKAADGVLSFDDLLQRTAEALRPGRPGEVLLQALRQRYRAALVDEFQDTDSRQWSIFATCFHGMPLFLIGDPKQSIYGFRGANLHTYQQAAKAAARHYTLNVNFRSAASLVRAVQRLFRRPDPFADKAIELPAVTAAAPPERLRLQDDHTASLCWRVLPVARGAKGKAKGEKRNEAEAAILEDVTAEIVRLLQHARIDGRPVRPADIAILARTNLQATAMQERLRKAGVPATIGKAGDIFATDELTELRQLLTAVLRPNDAMTARAAQATRLWGRSASELAAGDDDTGLDLAISQLDLWRRLWLRHGIVTMFEQVLVDLQVHRRWLGEQGGERRLTNLRHLVELMHEAEHSHRLAPESVLEWLQREQAHQEDLDYTVRELRLETDEDAATIMTVHGSKGLQFEIVFCPFAWHGMDPRATEVVSDNGTHRMAFKIAKRDEHSTDWAMVAAQNLAEELRLCYVAMTRAVRRCYVHVGVVGRDASCHSGLAWLLSPRPCRAGDDGDGRESPLWALRFTDRVAHEALRWHEVLAGMVADEPDAMRIDAVPMPAAASTPTAAEPVYRAPAPAAEPAAGRARVPERRLRARGLHSFSSLVAHTAALDAVPDVLDPPMPRTERAAPGSGIFGFARGAAAGQCLHDILEHTDFAQLTEPATAERVHRTLAAHGLLAPGNHPGALDPVPTVLQLLHDIDQAVLPDGGPRLGALCRSSQAEWQFLLPTSNAGTEALAALLAADADPTVRRQGERLRALHRQTLQGFLGGFVDLVAEAHGRYWVIDWKSNHLGDSAADYGEAALADAMVEHDYLLQYHLYLLALHRHLRTRLADYDYDRHIGGACYVFLRAVARDLGAGLFVEQVPRARIEALDRWVDGAEASA